MELINEKLTDLIKAERKRLSTIVADYQTHMRALVKLKTVDLPSWAEQQDRLIGAEREARAALAELMRRRTDAAFDANPQWPDLTGAGVPVIDLPGTVDLAGVLAPPDWYHPDYHRHQLQRHNLKPVEFRSYVLKQPQDSGTELEFSFYNENPEHASVAFTGEVIGNDSVLTAGVFRYVLPAVPFDGYAKWDVPQETRVSEVRVTDGAHFSCQTIVRQNPEAEDFMLTREVNDAFHWITAPEIFAAGGEDFLVGQLIGRKTAFNAFPIHRGAMPTIFVGLCVYAWTQGDRLTFREYNWISQHPGLTVWYYPLP